MDSVTALDSVADMPGVCEFCQREPIGNLYVPKDLYQCLSDLAYFHLKEAGFREARTISKVRVVAQALAVVIGVITWYTQLSRWIVLIPLILSYAILWLVIEGIEYFVKHGSLLYFESIEGRTVSLDARVTGDLMEFTARYVEDYFPTLRAPKYKETRHAPVGDLFHADGYVAAGAWTEMRLTLQALFESSTKKDQ
ncbi:MAG: hypothetical protein KVP17_002602 [Porospora cf. gigantea B]|uniref:uncharacterized protein n=1 Tax=Porospora cf. gigantea B TaxID=2853592 RepID=UPI003571BFA2|nr:MAG: hypothetical protein KVP17_002602 [Porospora cf. gigantea B]